ncbi:MAG: hypothetical protein QW505_05010 [Thermoplasmata archaeon]
MRSPLLTFEMTPDAQSRYERIKANKGVLIDVSVQNIMMLGLENLLGERSASRQFSGDSALSLELARMRQSKEAISHLLKQTSDNLAQSIKCRSDYARDSERLSRGIEFYDKVIPEMEKALRDHQARKQSQSERQ